MDGGSGGLGTGTGGLTRLEATVRMPWTGMGVLVCGGSWLFWPWCSFVAG